MLKNKYRIETHTPAGRNPANKALFPVQSGKASQAPEKKQEAKENGQIEPLVIPH